MQQLPILAEFNAELIPAVELSTFTLRNAVRGVICNQNDQVALLYSSSQHYYYLPGGKFENIELPIEALQRECNEQIGCTITNIHPLGVTNEIRGRNTTISKTFGYVGFVDSYLDSVTIPTNSETLWVTPSAAIRLVKSIRTYANIYAEYSKLKDILILEAALNFRQNLVSDAIATVNPNFIHKV